MFRIYWINFGYYASQEFETAEQAITYGKEKFFEFRVEQDNVIICSWSLFGGLRYW